MLFTRAVLTYLDMFMSLSDQSDGEWLHELTAPEHADITDVAGAKYRAGTHNQHLLGGRDKGIDWHSQTPCNP